MLVSYVGSPFQLVLVVFAALAAYELGPIGTSLYSFHPTLLIFGFYACMANAIYIQKYVKSAQRTWLHLYANAAGVVAALSGYAAIYLNKERSGKYHLTSWHAWFGIAALALVTTQTLGALYFMWPTNKDRRAWRTLHARFGTAAWLLGATAALIKSWRVDKFAAEGFVGRATLQFALHAAVAAFCVLTLFRRYDL